MISSVGPDIKTNLRTSIFPQITEKIELSAIIVPKTLDSRTSSAAHCCAQTPLPLVQSVNVSQCVVAHTFLSNIR